MDKTVPAGAALLLDFIASVEAPFGYGTIYGNNQNKLPGPITTMRLVEVIAAQPGWTKKYGSSACGRYQFMRATLLNLKTELGLSGMEFFDPDLQDRLGYHLLKRRGYAAFMAGSLSPTGFGLKLAQEWASFPVLESVQGAHRKVTRGQTYYAGDGLNKSLLKPEAVEAMLAKALKLLAVPGGTVATAGGVTVAPLPTPAPTGPLVSPAPRNGGSVTFPVPPSTGTTLAPAAPGILARIADRLRTAFPSKKV